MVSLRRLSDDAARASAAPRVLARPAEVPQTPLRILLIERGPNRLPGNRLLRPTLGSTGLPRCTRLLSHDNFSCSEHSTLPHFSQQFTVAESGNSHAAHLPQPTNEKAGRTPIEPDRL